MMKSLAIALAFISCGANASTIQFEGGGTTHTFSNGTTLELATYDVFAQNPSGPNGFFDLWSATFTGGASGGLIGDAIRFYWTPTEEEIAHISARIGEPAWWFNRGHYSVPRMIPDPQGNLSLSGFYRLTQLPCEGFSMNTPTIMVSSWRECDTGSVLDRTTGWGAANQAVTHAPIPHAALLLLSGLVGIGGFKRLRG